LIPHLASNGVNDLVAEALIKRKYKKIGVVGLPCHIHGLRKLQAAGYIDLEGHPPEIIPASIMGWEAKRLSDQTPLLYLATAIPLQIALARPMP
jgi:hypothetical protein